MYSFGTVVTVSPWHLGQAACVDMCPRRPLSMTCPWPERADMGVPMAACMAVTMGKLSPVPRDEQIALWREHMTSSMTVAVLGVSRGDAVGSFCTHCGLPRHRVRTRIGLLHASGSDACSNPARLRWACRRRPRGVQNRPHVRRPNVKVLLSGWPTQK